MYPSIKILLLQARHPNDPVRSEELGAFVARAGVEPHQFVPHDLLEGPPSLAKIRQYDALMVGGSGDFYASKENLPDFPLLMEVLADTVVVKHPTFASCFGFHLLVRALDGELVHDPPNMEVGTFDIHLTEEGQSDELLGCLSPTFLAQVGRKDRATRLPPEMLHLASSDLCPYHAMRAPHAPIWATQFHPELTCGDNRTRFLRYQEGYAPFLHSDQIDRMLDDRFRDSPETLQLIPRFLELVFG